MQNQVRKKVGKMMPKNMKIEPTWTPKWNRNREKSGKIRSKDQSRKMIAKRVPKAQSGDLQSARGDSNSKDILRIGYILIDKLIDKLIERETYAGSNTPRAPEARSGYTGPTGPFGLAHCCVRAFSATRFIPLPSRGSTSSFQLSFPASRLRLPFFLCLGRHQGPDTFGPSIDPVSPSSKFHFPEF